MPVSSSLRQVWRLSLAKMAFEFRFNSHVANCGALLRDLSWNFLILYILCKIYSLVVILNCILILRPRNVLLEIYIGGKRKIVISYCTNKLFAEDFLRTKSSHFVARKRGTDTPPNSTTQFLNFCFRHQTFMRHRTSSKKNSPRNYQGPRARFGSYSAGKRVGMKTKQDMARKKGKGKERRGVSRPKF